MARPEDKRRSQDAASRKVGQLSRLFTRDRRDLPQAYLRNADLREAYRAYFLPVNTDKVHLPLFELSLHPSGSLERERLKVLDIGAGPGSALLGVLSFFHDRDRAPGLQFTAVDEVAENLRTASELFEGVRNGYGAQAKLRTMTCRIEDLRDRLEGPFDLVIAANVLNEMHRGESDRVAKRVRLMDELLRNRLANGGSCIIIEPALRETSRDLLGLRDGMLDAGWNVYSPCLLQRHCPALVNPKDWCHEDRKWDAPEEVRSIDARTGLRKDSLKFSYTVLRKDGASLSDVHGNDAFRVVSEPLISKGKIDIFLCGKEGRRIATRLDRDASTPNAAFAGLLRGDVVRFEGLEKEEQRFRVTRQTTVNVCPRFDYQGTPGEEAR